MSGDLRSEVRGHKEGMCNFILSVYLSGLYEEADMTFLKTETIV